MMQSIEEHQENPRGEAAVMLVGGLRKRRRVRNLAAEHRQKAKERIWGYCGSRKGVIIAGRGMTCHARGAWRRKNVIRKDQTRNQAEQGTPKRQGETVERPGMQHWHKGPRHKTTAMSWKRENNSMIYRKTIGLEIVKRAVGISCRLRKIRKWTLWRVLPPPK
jgi:hypothetical protein